MREPLVRLLDRYPELVNCVEQIENAFYSLVETIRRDGTILICGNGGSAADSDHIVGELMKGFNNPRPLGKIDVSGLVNTFGIEGEKLAYNLQGAIRAISLSAHSALATAFSNDCDPEFVFAQQVWGYGRDGDTLICISTSGNSRNVLQAARIGKMRGMTVIGLTGATGGKLADLSDVSISVPSTRTSDIQEYHLPVYHSLCLMLEEHFFGKG